MMTITDELRQKLAEQGLGVRPINRDKYAIKDEPKWQLYRLDENK